MKNNDNKNKSDHNFSENTDKKGKLSLFCYLGILKKPKIQQDAC